MIYFSMVIIMEENQVNNQSQVNQITNGITNILIYILFMYGFDIIISIVIKSIVEDAYLRQGLLNFVSYVILLTVLLIYNLNLFKGKFKELIHSKKLQKNILLNFLIVFAVTFVCSNVIANFQTIYNSLVTLNAPVNAFNIINQNNFIITSSDNQNLIVDLLHNKSTFLITLLSAVALGPVVEELIFRHSLFALFKKEEIGLLVSSILFSMVHIISSLGNFNFPSIALMFIDYAISGLLFGIVYLKSNKNFLVTTAIHMLYNALSILLVLVL